MHWIWRCVFLLLFTACGTNEGDQKKDSEGKEKSNETVQSVSPGLWRFSMNITSERELPFTVSFSKEGESYAATFINAEEELPAESVVISGDSLTINMPIFRSEFKAAIITPDSLSGIWINHAKGDDYQVPFTGISSVDRRFPEPGCSGKPETFGGKYEVTFSPNTDDEYKAIGVFEQNADKVTGTFITETGDYRFLEGNINCSTLDLSTFDGSHAFLFTAARNSDSIRGLFYSGKHWKEPWVAVKNPDFELRHPDSLTHLKAGYESLSFTLPDLDSNLVKFPSEEYHGDVVVIQLIGSWCPNCMDETKMYSSFYDKYHDQGLEMISLGFEAQREFSEAAESLSRLKAYFDVDYKFLVAGYASKQEAGEVLPMLDHVMSFPTCIFIDREGRVRKISTGFYGPGTGDYYLRYKENTESFIRKLLAE